MKANHQSADRFNKTKAGRAEMNAAICDDSTELLSEMKSLTENSKYFLEIHTYSTWREMDAAISSGMKFEVIFMDIELGDSCSGIDYAERLYEILPDARIVFITSYSKYSQDVFLRRLNLAGLLLKPVEQEKLNLLVEKISLNMHMRSVQKLLLSFRQKNTMVSMEQILYLESIGHTILVHLKDGHVEKSNGKLAEIFRKLPEYFSQCHQSYIVNMNEISELKGDTVFLTDGVAIPISRSRYADFRETYFEYLSDSI